MRLNTIVILISLFSFNITTSSVSSDSQQGIPNYEEMGGNELPQPETENEASEEAQTTQIDTMAKPEQIYDP